MSSSPVGGLFPYQYNVYLNPVNEKQAKEKNRTYLFNLIRNPLFTLAIVLNRLAFFLLSRFSAYPNNTYLFEKFKTHIFKDVSTETEYETIQQIFERFKFCPEISAVELNKVQQQLDSIAKSWEEETIFSPEEGSILDPEEVISDDEELNQGAGPSPVETLAKTPDAKKSSIPVKEKTPVVNPQEKEKTPVQIKPEVPVVSPPREKEESPVQIQTEPETSEKQTSPPVTVEISPGSEYLDPVYPAANESAKTPQVDSKDELDQKPQVDPAVDNEKEQQEAENLLRKQQEELEAKRWEQEQAELLIKAQQEEGQRVLAAIKQQDWDFSVPYSPSDETSSQSEDLNQHKQPSTSSEDSDMLNSQPEPSALIEENPEKMATVIPLSKGIPLNIQTKPKISDLLDVAQRVKKEKEDKQQIEKAKEKERSAAAEQEKLRKEQENIKLQKARQALEQEVEEAKKEAENNIADRIKQKFLSLKNKIGKSSNSLTTSSSEERLDDLRNLTESQTSLSNSLIEVDASPKVIVVEKPSIPLSANVEKAVNQKFPLNDSESLLDLTQKDKTIRSAYYRDLATLLSFENKLVLEHKQTTDSRFDAYLRKMDNAFQKGWTIACQKSISLHHEFKKAFPHSIPKLTDEGEIVCSTAQFDWATETLSKQFPSLYQLAFDFPRLGISQKLQLVSLVQILFFGKIDDLKKSQSIFCIRLQEIDHQTIAVVKEKSEYNPLVKEGSFVYTHFVTSRGQVLLENGENCKKQLNNMVAEYVKDWLMRPGSFLKFDGKTITGGQSKEAIKASEWVVHVRDSYTKTLFNLTPDELKKEIDNLSKCPLVAMINKTYGQDIKSEEYNSSIFPAALMEKIFDNQLKRTEDNPILHSAIEHTIQDASFKDSTLIKTLAQRAGCLESQIEPLIRARVLYLINCLGQTAAEPVARSIALRATKMYDPTICEDKHSKAIGCNPSGELILSFDGRFDQLNFDVRTTFSNVNSKQEIAQGYASLKVNSISNTDKTIVETTSVPLRDLQFNLYANQSERRYLTAQVEPQTLIDDMQKLVQEIANLKFLQKPKELEKAKEKAAANKSWFKFGNGFKAEEHFNSKQDKEDLVEAIHKIKNFVTYLNTLEVLHSYDQLSDQQLESFKTAYHQIRSQFYPSSKEELNIESFNVLEELYGKEFVEVERQAFGELLNYTTEEIGKILSSEKKKTV